MNRIKLTDKQWGTIRDYLRGHPRVHVGDAPVGVDSLWRQYCGFCAAAPSGPVTCDVGREVGIYIQAISRWSEHGVWNGLLEHVSVRWDVPEACSRRKSTP